MPPSDERNYVASLTGLRGVAALAVFAFHYNVFNPGIRLDLSVPVIGWFLQFPLGFGFSGVDLFFVLSGFLLTLPFARAALQHQHYQPVTHYYKRRILRVFPAYYAQLFIILAVGAWFVTWHEVDGKSVLAHLFMFFYIGPEPVRPIVGIWWTLPVELSFYLVLPLLAFFLRPGRWVLLLFLCIPLSMVYRYWAASLLGAVPAQGIFLYASLLPGSLPEFLLGSSAALVVQYCDLKSINKPPPWVLDLMFVAGASLAVMWLWNVVFTYRSTYWLGHWSMIIAPAAFGLPLALMVLGLYWGSRLGRILFANPVVYYFGLISYSLYLWHFVVLQQLEVVLVELGVTLSRFPKFLLSVALVVLVSSISYFLFERPFFKLGDRRAPTTRG